jgi:hypothetical protein
MNDVKAAFGGVLRSRMSEATQRTIALNEAGEQRAEQLEERARRERAERLEENAIRAAVEQAYQFGEHVSAQQIARGELGHTRSEFLSLVTAREDAEERLAEARQRREFRRWQEGHWADNSAPTPEQETSARKAREAVEERQAALRADRERRAEQRRTEERSVLSTISYLRKHGVS